MHEGSRQSWRAAVLHGVWLTALGQALLLLVEDRTRAASENVGRSGPAFIAPDSRVYLSLASDGSALTNIPWNRRAYIALLRIGESVGDAATTVVVLQLLLLAIGAALLYRLAQRLAGHTAGILSAGALAVNPLTAQWARFVLTETMFYVLVVVAMYASFMVLRARGSWAYGLIAIGSSVVATMTRPNGVLLMGGVLTIVVLASLSPERRTARALLIVAVWGMTATGLLLGADATGGPTERSFVEQLFEGIVVEGAERVVVRVPMPEAPDDTSLRAAARYVSANAPSVARLMIARIVVESAQVRPHLPVTINAVFGTFMIAYLMGAILGWRRAREGGLTRVVILLGVPQVVLVGATFAVPEGRYGWAYLLLLAPVAGIGGSRALRSVSNVLRVPGAGNR